MTYAEKLRDPRWQRKRLEVFERDGFACQATGYTDQPLCVHHMRYHGEPWQAPNEELETLCMDVHQLIEPFAFSLRRMYPRFAFRGRDVWDMIWVTDDERLKRGESPIEKEPLFWKIHLEVVCRVADSYGACK